MNPRESDLRWFFGGCRVSFDSSATGPMLERLEQYSVTERGERVRSRAWVGERSWKHRQRQCEQPLGVFTEEEFAAMSPALDAMSVEDDPAITADYRTELREMAVEVSEVALYRYSSVRRALERMAQHHVEVLRLYYGPDGARWVSHRLGRLAVIYPLVAAGMGLLEQRASRYAKSNDPEATPLGKVVAEWDENLRWPDLARARRLRDCEEESRVLLAQSKASYWAVAATD